MRYKKSSFTFLLFISMFFSVAQNGTIVGKVYDEKSSVITGANVVIDALKGWAAITDMNGQYTISVPPGTYTVTFRGLGRAEQTKTATVQAGATFRMNAFLTRDESVTVDFVNDQTQTDITPVQNVKANYTLCGKLSEKAAFFYCVDLFKENYTDKTFANNYLKKYDKNYATYSSNEFTLNEKINQVKAEITNGVNNVNYGNVYTATFTSTLGEYNFETGKFAFNPFQFETQVFQSDFQYRKGGFQSYSDYYARFNLWNSAINGLVMASTDADRVVKNFPVEDTWNGKRVNRTVYLRVFYSPMKELNYRGASSDRPGGVYCYLHRVEVWADKCMSSNKIATIDAQTSPPSYLTQVHQQFINTHKGASSNETAYSTQLNTNQMLFASISHIQNKNNCNRPHFKLKLSFTRQDEESYIAVFNFQTNANVNFFPGYFYTITDLNGQQYPLVVKAISNAQTSSYPDGSLKNFSVNAELNIKKGTMKMFAEKGIAKIKIQVESSSDHPATGSGYKGRDGSLDIGNSEWWEWSIGEADRNQFKQLIYKIIQ